MVHEILRLVSRSIKKIEIQKKDLESNYIMNFEWTDVLEKLDDKKFMSAKKKTVAMKLRFLSENKFELNKEQEEKYRSLERQYGIIDVNSTAGSQDRGNNDETNVGDINPPRKSDPVDLPPLVSSDAVHKDKGGLDGSK